MFSRFQRFYNSIKVAIDVAMLTLAFGLAYLTRFYGRWPTPPPPLRETLVTLLPGAGASSRSPSARRNLYTTNRARTHIGEVFEIFKATITGDADAGRADVLRAASATRA